MVDTTFYETLWKNTNDILVRKFVLYLSGVILVHVGSVLGVGELGSNVLWVPSELGYHSFFNNSFFEFKLFFFNNLSKIINNHAQKKNFNLS